MQRRSFLLCITGVAAAGWTGWKAGSTLLAGRPVKVSRTAWAFGTDCTLTVFHDDVGRAQNAISAALAEIDAVEQVMSLYRPDSQICRLNATGRLADPHPWLLQVLQAAADLSRRTGGVFDVTVQPLMRLYLDAAAGGVLPDTAALAAARARVDWRRVEIAADGIRLHGDGTAVTLNGIAQGFAADAVASVLARHGIASALIDTGEISALGTHPDKDAWTIGIKHPRAPGEWIGLAGLHGRCLATSGDYETSFATDFSQHHLLDPRTGRSPAELASVSVIAPTALAADALSTAAFLLGPEAGMRLVQATTGADALFVAKDGARVQTPGFPMAG